MNNEEEPHIMVLSDTITQAAAAPASMGLRLTPQKGQEVEVMSYSIGKNDYAAARTQNVQILDSAGDVKIIYDIFSADNQVQDGPSEGHIASTVTGSTLDKIGKPPGHRFGAGATLEFEGVSHLVAENLTIVLFYKLWGSLLHGLPTVVAFGTDTSRSGTPIHAIQ